MGGTQTKSCIISNSIKKNRQDEQRKEKRNWDSYNSVISQDWTRGFTINLSLKTSINSLLAAISNTNLQLLRDELQITGVFLLTFLWLFCYYSLSFNYLGDLRWRQEKKKSSIDVRKRTFNQLKRVSDLARIKWPKCCDYACFLWLICLLHGIELNFVTICNLIQLLFIINFLCYHR